MKNKLIIAALAGILTLCFNVSKAQTSTAQLTPPSYSPAQIKAAERMIDASGMIGNLQKIFTTVIQSQSAQVPEDKRAGFIAVMQKFFAKYITGDQIKKSFEPIYASEYSIDEMNSIADFLLTPAGQAMTAKQPELMQKAMAWGQNIAIEHKDDLQAMMAEAFKEK